MRLKNKVAIVTGGASGIGAATCRLYAQEGAAGIVVADINEDAGRSVADDIVQSRWGGYFYPSGCQRGVPMDPYRECNGRTLWSTRYHSQ